MKKQGTDDISLSSLVYDGVLSAIIDLPAKERAEAIKCQSLHWTAACGGHIHILDYFHRHGGNLAAGECNALCGAVRSGHVAVIDWLHATITITPEQRAAAVTLAGQYAHLDAIKALYRHGAALKDIEKCARDTHSSAARAFLAEQKKALSADAVTTGCTDALRESSEEQKRNADRMKKAMRLFRL